MRAVILLIGLVMVCQAIAQEKSQDSITIDSSFRMADLTPFIQVLRDPQHRLTIEDIRSPGYSGEFRPLTELGKSLGFDDSVFWIKFSIDNQTSANLPLLLHFEYPVLDDITLYGVDRSGSMHSVRSGEKFPFLQREINFRNFVFNLEQQPGKNLTYFMRLQTEGSLQIPLSLWSSAAFIEYTDTSSMLYGLYYGVMLVLLIASIVVYVQQRDVLFLTYSLHLSSFLLLILAMNGFGFQYLWSGLWSWVNNFNSVLIGLAVVCSYIFSGTFLKVWQNRTWFAYVYNFFIASGCFSILLSVFIDSNVAVKVAVASGLILFPVILLSFVNAVLSGQKPAPLFLLAWGVFLTGGFVSSLVYEGVLDRNLLTHNSMQVASLLELLIMGYVLMNQVRLLNQEREVMHLAANHCLRELNEGLEVRVAERTRELKATNVMLSDLAIRDSMTGLLNHNTSIDHLNVMLRTSQRYGHNLSVIMLDLDHFKSVNNRFGHQVGDMVIQAVAQLLRHSVRESDVCGRFAGEQFVILMPETTGEDAYDIAENIRTSLMDVSLYEMNNTRITASFGISVFDAANPQTDLVREAEKALYMAKDNGRNQVVIRSALANRSEAV